MIKNTLFYGSFFFIGLFFIDTVLELATYPYDVLVWIGMLVGFIYLAHYEKDSIFNIFKDVHQSNLDDFQEQKRSEKSEETS